MPSTLPRAALLCLPLALAGCGGGTTSTSTTTTGSPHPLAYSVAYSFGALSGQADGSDPTSSLLRDAQGNLFGTTNSGGAYGYGTVFELSPDGQGGYTEHVLYSFGAQANQADGAYPASPLVADAHGNLFGTANEGGANGNAMNGTGVVFELSPNGNGGYAYSVLHSFSNGTGSDGQYPYGAPMVDASGHLYGVTPVGGAHGAGMVYELSPDGQGGYVETDLYDFGAQPNRADGANPEIDLTPDAQGNLYGSTYNGGAHNAGTVFKLAPNGNGGYTESVLYDFGTLASYADGSNPYSHLVLDGQGNLYGTTQAGGRYGNGTAFKLTASANGYVQSVLYSFGALPSNADGAWPEGPLLIDSHGNMFGTTVVGGAHGRGTVYKLTPDSASATGYTESVVYSLGGVPASGLPGVYADGAYPNQVGLVMDPAGALYGTASSGGTHGNYGVVFEIR